MPDASEQADPVPADQGAGDPNRVVEELLAELRRRVDRDRRQSRYPPGLEEDLDAHFRRIVSHHRPADPSSIDSSLDRLAHLEGLSPQRIPTDSGIPGGSALHRLVAKAVARQTQGILEQVEELSAALRSVISDLAAAIRQGDTHVHLGLLARVDAVQERLSALERQPAGAVGQAELLRRLERLEAQEARRRFRPTFRAADFEAAFRGSASELEERYQDLAQRFDGQSPVLDIGCGRGEMLELLRRIGIEARGVEMDADLVDDARSRGLDVVHGDGLAKLGAEADGSLGGLVLIQVAEHLSPQDLVDLVGLAFDKLRPGGRAVIETINPQSLYVYARAFYLDPTHDHLVHPAYLEFLFRQAGFPTVEIEWRSLPSSEESLEKVGDPAHDANIERLNSLLFAPQDYAVVATR